MVCEFWIPGRKRLHSSAYFGNLLSPRKPEWWKTMWRERCSRTESTKCPRHLSEVILNSPALAVLTNYFCHVSNFQVRPEEDTPSNPTDLWEKINHFCFKSLGYVVVGNATIQYRYNYFLSTFASSFSGYLYFVSHKFTHPV